MCRAHFSSDVAHICRFEAMGGKVFSGREQYLFPRLFSPSLRWGSANGLLIDLGIGHVFLEPE